MRELRYHVDRRVDDLIAAGLSESEARRQVGIEFGGVAEVQEEVRDTGIVEGLVVTQGGDRSACVGCQCIGAFGSGTSSRRRTPPEVFE